MTFNKRVVDNTVIFDNSEARWVFASGRPPHIDDYVVAITAINKKYQIPVMMYMSGRDFRQMLKDMRIKTLTDRRDDNSNAYSELKIAELKIIIKELLTVAESVDANWYSGCLFCGYKEHKSTCSLKNAIDKARHELKERVVYKGVEIELDNLTGLKSEE